MSNFSIHEVSVLVPVKDDEHVFLITRTHIIFFFFKTVLAVTSISLLLVIGSAIDIYVDSIAVLSLYNAIVYLFVAIIVLGYSVQLHNYYLSKQIVTDYRVIDYEQLGLFKSEVNEIFLVNIENLNTVQTGIFATIFDYGSVDVQTAGEKTELSTSGVVFEHVPTPKHVAQLISNFSQEAKERLESGA